MRLNIFYYFVFSILIFSCTKAQRGNWLVVDLTIKSSATGKPVNAFVEIERRSGSIIPLGEDQLVRSEIGITKDGHLFFEMPVARNDYNWKLIVSKGGWFVGGSYNLDHSVPINPGKKNEINLVWTPTHYLTRIKINNATCFDDTDSIWVSYYSEYNASYTEEKVFIGCIENVPFGNDLWTTNPTSKIRYRTKKNGIENNGEITYELEIEKANDFVLNY